MELCLVQAWASYFAAKKMHLRYRMWHVIILQLYTILPAVVTSVHLKPREINQFVTQLAGKASTRLAITTKWVKRVNQAEATLKSMAYTH